MKALKTNERQTPGKCVGFKSRVMYGNQMLWEKPETYPDREVPDSSIFWRVLACRLYTHFPAEQKEHELHKDTRPSVCRGNKNLTIKDVKMLCMTIKGAVYGGVKKKKEHLLRLLKTETRSWPSACSPDHTGRKRRLLRCSARRLSPHWWGPVAPGRSPNLLLRTQETLFTCQIEELKITPLLHAPCYKMFYSAGSRHR